MRTRLGLYATVCKIIFELDIHTLKILSGVREMNPIFVLSLHLVFALTVTTTSMGFAQETEKTIPIEAGEFSIPPTFILNDSQLDRLADLVVSHDNIRSLAQRAIVAAQPALTRPPVPLEIIEYEGLVHNDPRRIATVASLNQMGDIAKLLRAWQVSQDAVIAEHLRVLITAWTSRYVITGNDVNENKFAPLLMAYASLRDTFDPPDAHAVDTWVRELGAFHYQRSKVSGGVSNRYAKHLRITALCALILDQAEWQNVARQGAKRMIESGLHADGTSHDLLARDSLTYHGSAVKALIEISLLIEAADGEAPLYDWVAPSGASIRKSVDYVVPYANGQLTREEWRNTTVQLDRDRAAAGIAKYQPGRLFEPRQARALIEMAAIYDETLRPLAAQLAGPESDHATSWAALVYMISDVH